MKTDGDIRIRAGWLRRRVTITQMVPTDPPTTDESGPVLVPKVFAANVPAQIVAENSTDVLGNGQIVTHTKVTVTIRYLAGVQSNMQIVSDLGNTYIIQGLINIDERNVVMELDCLALGANS